MNLIFKIPASRRAFECDVPEVTQPGSVTMALACHWVGSGNSKASTSTTDNRVAATGLSNVQQGSSVKASDSAIVVKDNSKILSPGATENSGTITVTGASDSLIQTVLQGVDNVVAGAEATQAAGNQQLSGILNSAVTSLADTKQKEGEAQRNMNMLYIVLAAFALLGFIIIRGRK